MTAEAAPLTGVRVVLVDDEPDALEFLALVLETEGAHVLPFGDADAALESIVSDPPDVVLSDLYMPQMSGWEMIERARLRGVTVPAAAMTAHPSVENRSRCVAAGFCACIGKPLAPAEIVHLVRELSSGVSARSRQRSAGESAEKT
jgi:DNA-binding response OmpR family regulator